MCSITCERVLKSGWTLLALLPLCVLAGGFPTGHKDALGSKYDTRRSSEEVAALQDSKSLPSATTERLKYWSRVAVDTSGLDHTPVAAHETRTFGEQLGPGRAARAMAIVHIAMFDALNAFQPRYQSYVQLAPPSRTASRGAAVAQAAHDTLVALFPSQTAHLDLLLAQDLKRIRNSRGAVAAGLLVGQQAAAELLALRAHDHSHHSEPYAGVDYLLSNLPGKWRPDPISNGPLAMGAKWGEMESFVSMKIARFRPPPPPAMNSEQYAQAFDQVKRLGGDGINTPTQRSPEQTTIGIFWAYDGTPSLCAPPRLYNQITLHIAEQQATTDTLELARLLALVNTAMSDAAVVGWEAKYYYHLWRPVTAIREADEDTGPSGKGDGNAATRADPNFTPLGAPASNLTGPNFTPPFPSYPSGHAIIGAAMFQILREFYGTDDIAFTFISDEYNGITVDNTGAVRPLLPRTFKTLSQAERENGLSRIYLGIHWAFDIEAGITAGRAVGSHVYRSAFTPLKAE